jgi:hypothetical protein
MVIVAIIMGLGITTLLRGTVGALRRGSNLKPGLLHGMWVALVLFHQVVLWSLRWAGERREEWPAGILLLYLFIPIIFYSQAELLFPRGTEQVRLTDYFLENRRPFFALSILAYLAGAAGPYVFYDGVDPISGGTPTLLPFMILISGCVVLAISKSERLHLALAGLLLVSMTFNLLPSLGVG